MSSELPKLSIQRHIEVGRCRVGYTLMPDILDVFLTQAEVNNVADLPDDFLRELCHRASHEGMKRDMERAEEMSPGGTAIVVGQDTQGKDVELRSANIGFDMMERFVADPDPNDATLCDPTYNPVDFELRVFDTGPRASQDPRQNIGICVLRITLQPPSLA